MTPEQALQRAQQQAISCGIWGARLRREVRESVAKADAEIKAGKCASYFYTKGAAA